MAFDLSPSPAATQAPAHCLACPVQRCLSRKAETAEDWHRVVGLMPPLQAGRSKLVEAGLPLPALFTVRAGCIKSYTIDARGNEHVRAFHFPGDLVGLDALGARRAPASATPVTFSQVCAVKVEDLDAGIERNPAFNRHLLQRTREALGRAMALSGEYTADQRVAAFLLDVHARIGVGDVIRLPMTRREIGSYLRLATETVCRVLTRFEKRGWLTSADKRITLHYQEALRDLAEPVGL